MSSKTLQKIALLNQSLQRTQPPIVQEDEHADTLLDYIKSPTNLKLLKSFSFSKLRPSWTLSSEFLLDCIDMYIQEAIEDVSEKYKHWTLTPKNLADINVDIWTHIKQKIKDLLASRMLSDEERFQAHFKDRNVDIAHEEPSDHVAQERSMDHLEAHYQASWK